MSSCEPHQISFHIISELLICLLCFMEVSSALCYGYRCEASSRILCSPFVCNCSNFCSTVGHTVKWEHQVDISSMWAVNELTSPTMKAPPPIANTSPPVQVPGMGIKWPSGSRGSLPTSWVDLGKENFKLDLVWEGALVLCKREEPRY